MKKFLAVFLALTMIILLGACGKDPSEMTDSTTESATTVDTKTTETTKATETTKTTGTTESTTETTETTAPPVVIKPVEFDESKVVLSFGAVSDVHVNAASGDAVDKVKSAIAQLTKEASKNGGRLDALAVVGDIADTGKAAELGYFKSAIESVLPDDVKTLLVTGNHDSIMGQCLNLMDYELAFGEKYFGEGIDTEDTNLSIGVRDCVVNGYHFLMLEPETYSKTMGCPYSKEAVEWLDNMLRKLTEENPEQYVFVCTHPMIYNTCYGSDLDGNPSYWSTTYLTPTLSKYSQVVTFSGHLHFPINDNRSIMQGAFTSLGCGSVRYMAIEAGGYENMAGATTMNDRYEISSGLLVQVDENGNVKVTKMFFSENTSFEEPWTIAHPDAEGTHLKKYSRETREAANKAPTLGNVKIDPRENTKTGVKTYLTFDAAIDDEFAHHYEIEIKHITAGKVINKKILSDFYHHAKRSDMKKSYELFLGNLKDGKYKVTLTAYDSWGAASDTFVYEWESTKGEVTVKKAALYADFDFSGGTVKDALGRIEVTNMGATIENATVIHGGKAYTADALKASEDKYVICKFKELTTQDAFKSWAENGFSVEAFYVMPAKGSVQGIICGTQAGGWGLAEDKTGKPYFLTGGGTSYNTGAYATSASAELVHVVGVYSISDGKCYIYVNGKLNASVPINSTFKVGADGTFNYFCLGNDITKGNVGGDFPTKGMTMVDGKIYTGALTAEQIAEAYNSALKLLK